MFTLKLNFLMLIFKDLSSKIIKVFLVILLHKIQKLQIDIIVLERELL